ncbi:hypothetical protein HDU96_005508 [Phlyctochytrium bullatum]|nr:hypothetical protein HDU96_005508 [Phlyctochytrium bullatum]
METVVIACIVLHNLIIDHEKMHGMDSDYISDAEYVPEHPFEVIPAGADAHARPFDMAAFRINVGRVQNRNLHTQLKNDWCSRFGGVMEKDNDVK